MDHQVRACQIREDGSGEKESLIEFWRLDRTWAREDAEGVGPMTRTAEAGGSGKAALGPGVAKRKGNW